MQIYVAKTNMAAPWPIKSIKRGYAYVELAKSVLQAS